MKADAEKKPKIAITRPKFVTIGNAAKPITLHPLPFETAVASLLKVKPPIKPEKSKL